MTVSNHLFEDLKCLCYDQRGSICRNWPSYFPEMALFRYLACALLNFISLFIDYPAHLDFELNQLV